MRFWAPADPRMAALQRELGLSNSLAVLLGVMLDETAPTRARLEEALRNAGARFDNPKNLDMQLSRLRARLHGTARIETLHGSTRGAPVIGWSLDDAGRARLWERLDGAAAGRSP